MGRRVNATPAVTDPKASPTSPAQPAEPPAAVRVLVADDEESILYFLRKGLRRLGYEVEAVDGGEAAVAAWSAQPFDLAILDLKMPGTDGLKALARIRAGDPQAAVVLMTAHGTIATAVEAMKVGACDFVTKPFELDELELRIRRVLEHRRTAAEVSNLRRLLGAQGDFAGLVGQSAAMRAVFATIDLLRDSNATVLITGESGTGKGMVAQALHCTSARRTGPFVPLHCPALPDALLESELFGHEPGAFTGARTRKAGLIAKAQRGTLFLDEISEMSLAAQAKLERFLQEREFLPLGASEPVRVDVRVLAATNRDLQAAVAAGRFRSELLWRLDVVRIPVPALRERSGDVPLLVMDALAGIAGRERAPQQTVTADAMAALAAHAWPGNVRELLNVVERMAVLAGPRDVLGTGDLPVELRGADAPPPADADYESAVNHFERAYVLRLLALCRGNVTEAARIANLSRGHVHRRIRALGIDPDHYR
jgi:DNA-binding NtrC family response regulator